jgi:hypothetical protein
VAEPVNAATSALAESPAESAGTDPGAAAADGEEPVTGEAPSASQPANA